MAASSGGVVAASQIEPGLDDVCQLAPWWLLKGPTKGRFGRRGGPVRKPTIKEGRTLCRVPEKGRARPDGQLPPSKLETAGRR